ncbi:hypothetical protein K491DRAFT_104894 [Lophiostoma macrostomum CBS 122681]|uniref:Uncharacterized protein n=1 Tax=Lophiostoma macrostomum CBS 122681 TaxID=1314788 RepID=A0A6A6SX49_9PLEO|nr:hypothetical protein K491DRAFT_104894 [Lophiostoma macrostomum CBS 122681]
MLSYNAPTASTDDRKRKAGGPDRPLQAKRRDHSQCGDIASQQFEYLEKPGQSVQSSTRLKCPYYQQNPSRYQKKSCKDVTYDTMRGVKYVTFLFPDSFNVFKDGIWSACMRKLQIAAAAAAVPLVPKCSRNCEASTSIGLRSLAPIRSRSGSSCSKSFLGQRRWCHLPVSTSRLSH